MTEGDLVAVRLVRVRANEDGTFLAGFTNCIGETGQIDTIVSEAIRNEGGFYFIRRYFDNSSASCDQRSRLIGSAGDIAEERPIAPTAPERM